MTQGSPVHATLDDRDLLRRYHEGGDASAREALVQRHLPLVRSLARRYADVFSLFVKYDVGRVTFWGLTDATSWLNNFPIPGRVNYPLLWGRDGKPKPAFDAVVDVLKKAH